MKKQCIVGIGEVLWDLLPEGRKSGGAPANFAYHVSQFGYEALAVSAIGRDRPGDDLAAEFRKKGLDVWLQRVDFPTGTVAVTLDEKGIPQYAIRENVAWDHIGFTDELAALAQRTCCVSFGSLAQRSPVSGDTIGRFLAAMPADSIRIFDINLRQRFYTAESVRRSLERCNVLKINDAEALEIARLFGFGLSDLPDICLRLRSEYALGQVILTCGENGSYVFYDRGISFLHTPEVQVADTVGAGDSFTAGFCAALLAGRPVPEAHALAVEVSAYVCTREGAMPQLPAWILQRIPPVSGA